MRICILSARLYPQVVGSGTSAHLMATALSERGHHVTVITDHVLRNDHAKEELPYEVEYIDGLEDYAMGVKSFQQPTTELHTLLIQLQPQILHVCNFMPMMLVSMIRHLLPFPVVFTFYNTPVKDTRSIGYFDKPELDLGLASFILKSNAYERLIAGGKYYYDSAIRLGANPEKTTMSPLGVDMKTLLADAQLHHDIDIAEYLGDQLQAGEEYIVLPSRITKQKGVLEAVRSLAIVNEHYPIKLLLTGMARPFDEDYAQQVMELADELGVVDKIISPIQIIPRHHLPYFIKNARLVIVPSHYEGLGLAAIEALILGTPLVASETVGLNEVVQHNVSGLTFPPGDYHELSVAILRTLQDVEAATAMSQNAKAAITRFDLNAHIDSVEATYEQLVKG